MRLFNAISAGHTGQIQTVQAVAEYMANELGETLRNQCLYPHQTNEELSVSMMHVC